MMKDTVLGSAYFGPIQYYTKLANPASACIIEQHDHYLKQTYRNRAIILSANGTEAMIIPVVKTNGNKTKTKDIQVFEGEKWQRAHLRTLTSAYKNSPFFEFYMDAIMPVFERRWKYLLDLNCFTIDIIANEMEHEMPYTLSKGYMEANRFTDYRELINPKKDAVALDPTFNALPYRQVFGEKFPFQANLSILDLLFNKGPEAIDLMMACSMPQA